MTTDSDQISLLEFSGGSTPSDHHDSDMATALTADALLDYELEKFKKQKTSQTTPSPRSDLDATKNIQDSDGLSYDRKSTWNDIHGISSIRDSGATSYQFGV